MRFDLEGIPSRAARQKDAKRIMKRKERKEGGVKFPRGARVWGTKILAGEGTRTLKTRGGVKRKMVQECREEGRRKEKERERERLAKKDFSKDPLGSNVAFIDLLFAKHWSRALG